MIKVYVKKQANYPIKASEIKHNLKDFFKKQGIVSDAQVSVAIVGEKKMLDISKKYLKDNKVHNVLSFTHEGSKGEFVYPPGERIDLGEIIVCYPKAIEEAQSESKKVADKINELIRHAGMHLMGIHH
jgi:probable rRNA maturation factor